MAYRIISSSFEWYPEEFIKQTEGKVDHGLDELSEMIKEEAKTQCPVKTGALRNSITKEVYADEHTAYVGSDLPYSLYVELGTRKNAANPFLRRALDKAEEFLAVIFGK